MPGESFPEQLIRARHLGRVAVLAADGHVLAPCHPARARALLRCGRARLIRREPVVIRLCAGADKP